MPPSPAVDSTLLGDARRLLGIAWDVAPSRIVMEVALLFTVGLVGGAGLLMLVPIVNSLAAGGGAQTVDIPVVGAVDLNGLPLPVLLAAVVGLTAIQAAAQRASTINSEILDETVAAHLRSRAFDAVLGARWSFLLDRQRSDIIASVANGSERAGLALGQMLSGAVTAVVALATAVVSLLVEPALSALAIVGTLVLGAALATSVRPAYRIGELFGDRARAVQAVMTDSLDSLRLVRAHDAADVWRSALAEAFAGSRDVNVLYTRRTATVSAAAQVGIVASAAILVLVAVWMEVPPPTIVIVLLLIARLARSVQSLAATSQRIAHDLPGIREIEELTEAALRAAEHPVGQAPSTPDPDQAPADHPTEDGPSGSGRPTTPHAPLVALRDVSFHYRDGLGGVSHLSLDIPTGQVTALTGPSGAGKSTTADIVLGLLEPDSGQVLIEGRPLTRAGLRAWRTRIAYVPQETLLIPGTLRRNLLWSVGHADDDECWRALDRAAARFARDLPDGLDTPLGDRGVRLSGGERQRVAIARALLRTPDLLVLDEATSALDDATEAAVLELLATLTPAVTVLVIAHRRSTVHAAAHVVELAPDGALRLPD